MVEFESLEDMLLWCTQYKIPYKLSTVNRTEYNETNELIQYAIDLAYLQSPALLEHELSVLLQEYRMEDTWYKSVLLQDKVNGNFILCLIFQLV